MSPQRNWFGHCIQSSVRDAVADRRPATEARSDLSSRFNPGSLQSKNPQLPEPGDGYRRYPSSGDEVDGSARPLRIRIPCVDFVQRNEANDREA
jgi:hypothetical protein